MRELGVATWFKLPNGAGGVVMLWSGYPLTFYI